MSGTRFTRQTLLTPDALGLNGVTLAAERTSSVIDLKGASRLAIYLNFTRAAYTALSVAVDFSPEVAADYVAYLEQSVATASGTGTCSDFTFSKTTSSSVKYTLRLKDLDAQSAKIRINSTAGGASDSVIVKAIVSYEG